MTESSVNSIIYPFILATPQHRLGGRAIGTLVACLTPLISIPWNWMAWGRSQTPGMNSLKLRVYSTDNGEPVTRGKMFQRQVSIPLIYCVVPSIYTAIGDKLVSNPSHLGLGEIFHALAALMLLGIYLTDVLWMYKGKMRQRLRDVFAHTVVLNECISTHAETGPSNE